MLYFEQQLALLKTEREEDRKAYQALRENTTIAARRTNGITWYPIAIRDTEPGYGDYLSVTLERTTHQDIYHQFRTGVSVIIFSGIDPEARQIEGVVAHQSGNRIRINLRTDELPEWTREGKLGIDLLFDDNSYDEMEKALHRAVATAPDTDAGRLIQVLTGTKKPVFDQSVSVPVVSLLNASQQEAVQKICAAQDLTIVHGPPGTGKTTTLVQAIRTMARAQQQKKILVVAPSNTAADLLTERLADEGLNVLRVGNPARVSERLLSLTLDGKMETHSRTRDIKKLKKQANEFRDMAHKYKRSFGKAEREQRKALFQEAHRILKDVEQTEKYIAEDVIGKAEVITTTLVGAGHYTIRDLRYDAVVIDEAGQALEPACWIAILKAKKVILAGDHLQLPPTVKSTEAARNGLSITLLEKSVALHPEAVTLLEEQYRMNTVIMGYSSKVFYEDRLQAHASVAGHTLYPGSLPLHFIDTAGCGYDEQAEGTSTTNPEEAAFLLKHLSMELTELATQGAVAPTIAVIAPYKEQVRVLKEQLQHVPGLQQYLDQIIINTVDGFQGQERDVVYISLTRSNADGVIGFLSDIRRMNVAMTRARKKLVVIGDSATLSRDPFYAGFISYAEAQEAYASAWEFSDL